MLYIPKIYDYSKIFADEEVKDFVEFALLLYFFLTTPYEVGRKWNQIILIIVYITIMLRF